MTESIRQPSKPRLGNVLGLAVIFAVHLLFLLFFGVTAWHRLSMPEGDSGSLGLRFEESVYWTPETEMGVGQKSLMIVFWGYPFWVALSVYGSWKLLLRGKVWIAGGLAVLPFLSFLAGVVAIGLWGIDVRVSASRFFEDCQRKHPGVPGIIVIKGKGGDVIETGKVVESEAEF